MVGRLLLSLSIGFASAATLAGDLVVARSSDPHLTVGSIIDGDALLELAAGHSIVLIAKDGRVVRIDGPYRAAPDERTAKSTGSLLEILSRLLSSSDSASTMAVFRGAPRAAATVFVTLGDDETRCVTSGSRIRFRRPHASFTGELELSGPSSAQVRVPWPTLARDVAWPAAMPYQAGAEYVASIGREDARASTRVLTLPDTLPSPAHGVAWMAERGCERDARRALARLLR